MALIEWTVKDRVGYITLNRPEKRNALSPQLIEELKQQFTQAALNPDVKVIVLRANGEAFCAGADLAYLQQLQQYSYEENLADSRHLRELLHQMYSCEKVIIAQVQGSALAGGCGLISVCDYVVTVPAARFGYTEVRIGFIPALVMVFLLRKISGAKTRELLLSGMLLTAEQAQAAGLVYKIVEPSSLEAEVSTLAKHFVEQTSGMSVAATKRMFSVVQDLPLDEALDLACKENATARSTDDCRKGIGSFLNKQEIKW